MDYCRLWNTVKKEGSDDGTSCTVHTYMSLAFEEAIKCPVIASISNSALNFLKYGAVSKCSHILSGSNFILFHCRLLGSGEWGISPLIRSAQ
jgi:hypothetical protein